MSASDRNVLRELAERYMDVCRKDVQRERRELWRRHNSLKRTRPLIYVRAFAFDELPQSRCVCRDPLFRGIEYSLRSNLYWDSLGDDSIFEPWVNLPAAHRCYDWGVDIPRRVSDDPRGSYKLDYPVKRPEDIEKLRTPWHEIDEAATAAGAARLQETIGDLVPINIDRTPAFWWWAGDISTCLGALRGIENFMLDMMDNPEWLDRLVAFISAGILRVHEQAEAAGDWGLCSHWNQAMPYAEELADPAANANGARRRELWGFMAAQEFTAVSPEMHNDFLLRHQLPILREFGLVAYGCCEDLTRKIDMLRQIPNLRRIAVSPFANVEKCADQIGADYVLSYRPSPSDMVGYDFNPERIRRILTRDLRACRDCHTDITLKDVETVQGDPDRVRRWVELAREVIDKL